ncbi:MAG: GWxTD domain-containing protein [bacterium]|nr:GWxTD domain-containing protein [bacterium]
MLVGSFLCVQMVAQPSVYYNSTSFNTPQGLPFIETHITILGQTLFAKSENEKFKNSVNIICKIYSDSVLVKANKYNLIGPEFQRGSTAPSFIDNQRYSLPNGNYSVELTISDNYSPSLNSMTVYDRVSISYSDKLLQSSGVQALESFSVSTAVGPLTKSGYDLVPYTTNYYPESVTKLSFYLESYNAATVLGEKAPFVYSYYLEMAENGKKLSDYGAFRKQVSAEVNPLLGRFDISKLGTGDYNLVVELIDAKNVMQLRTKYFFQRLNRMVDVTALQGLSEIQLKAAYFGHCNNADTLKMFVECLWPIADGVDKERIINQSVKKDPELMKNFVVDFWQRRSADTADPLKMWASYYQSVQEVMVLFKCGKQKGYYTDRGRVYLQYGKPSQRAERPNEQNTFPYEIWQYYRTTDATNGQFFSNRKFVFVNKMLGDDCYKLIHSDMRGEINNPRWQFELTRRNNDGLSNPDNTTPAGTENNQFNDLFSNPR